MVDNVNAEPPVPASPGPKPKSAFVTFVTSSTGKLIVGGLVLFVAVVVLGALAFFFLFNAGSQNPVAIKIPGGRSKPATETVVPTNPPEQPLDETFTFRNVFAPTVKPAKEPVTTTASSNTNTTSTTPGSTTNGPKDTLILKSITVESGERVATFEWNNAEYPSKEGDVVDSSPWKVITINSDSVVMLYGDSRVTLTVGQGFSDGGVENTK